ncbi:MAG: hypothetical protein R3C59_09600 [Planctomycetaceae bacterium]
MSEEEEQQHEQSGGQRPIASFRGSGGLNVAVWKHKNEDGPDRYSVNIERSYRRQDETFESTQYLRDVDLLRVQKLLDQADEWIEQDKARQRSSGSMER